MIDPKHYTKYFFGLPLPCIQAEFLMKGSLGHNAFLFNTEKDFKIFFRKDHDYGKQGLDLYSNQKAFSKYFQEFKDYLETAKSLLIPKYRKIPEKLSKDEFIADMKFIGKLWHYYGFAEFPYIDYAFENGDENTMKNLNEISIFKFKARDLMNSYFFKGGVIENLLAYFGENAKYLYFNELLDSFEGKNVDEKIINERKQCYSAVVNKGEIKKFDLDTSLELSKKFDPVAKDTVIKGRVANQGYAKGKVVIAPLFDDQKDINRANKLMQKGDILVAESTSPDIIVLCEKAGAIVAEQGGYLSHAVIVSREFGIPCVIHALTATKVFKNGDMVEVDAHKGIVRKIK
ncbi:MAG: PEP-utilizing enzyme [Candidatus Woesearchaeota archaeon]